MRVIDSSCAYQNESFRSFATSIIHLRCSLFDATSILSVTFILVISLVSNHIRRSLPKGLLSLVFFYYNFLQEASFFTHTWPAQSKILLLTNIWFIIVFISYCLISFQKCRIPHCTRIHIFVIIISSRNVRTFPTLLLLAHILHTYIIVGRKYVV